MKQSRPKPRPRRSVCKPATFIVPTKPSLPANARSFKEINLMRYDLPFFDPTHRQLARDLTAWSATHLPEDEPADVDTRCCELVRMLGDAGWLRYCVPASSGGALPQLDSRALCIIRETLAYHSGLADFVFAMQGLGSGAITLTGT